MASKSIQSLNHVIDVEPTHNNLEQQSKNKFLDIFQMYSKSKTAISDLNNSVLLFGACCDEMEIICEFSVQSSRVFYGVEV